MKHFFLAIIFCMLLPSTHLDAAEFSTSVRTPAPLNSEGSIQGAFPHSEGRTAYYFFTDLQKGELLIQIFFNGSFGKEKRVELALLDENASLLSAYWIQGTDQQKDAIRSFPVAKASRQLFRVTVSGPETDQFRLEFGGSALPGTSSSPVATSATATVPPDSK